MFVDTAVDDPNLFMVQEVNLNRWGMDKWRVDVWHFIQGECVAIHTDIPYPPQTKNRRRAIEFCALQLSLHRKSKATGFENMNPVVRVPAVPELIELTPYEMQVVRP